MKGKGMDRLIIRLPYQRGSEEAYNILKDALEKVADKSEVHEDLLEYMERVDGVGFIWSPEDVTGRHNDMNDGFPEMSDEDAMEILMEAENGHDATIGFNWEVMDYYIDEWIENQEKAPQDSVVIIEEDVNV
jgi:hypothetical protein